MTTLLPNVLMVDDDVSIHHAVELQLRRRANLTCCKTAEAGLTAVKSQPFDVALVDMNLGTEASGAALISRLRELDGDLAAIVFTAHADYRTAVESLSAHAFDFIPKTLGDDREFMVKLERAIAHTREQRARTRSEQEAKRLRSALADAVVNNELELTSSDIQRGLLNESLHSFSALLGRVELLNVQLEKYQAKPLYNLGGLAKLSRETVAELHEHVGKLRDYFMQPERMVSSVNELISYVLRVMHDDYPELTAGKRIESVELKPDQRFTGEGRALFRAVVILLRLVLKSAPAGVGVTLKPALLLNPAGELQVLKARPYAFILNTPDFRKDDRTALAIEISGPGAELDVKQVAALFSASDLLLEGGPPWSAVAMIAKLNGALVVESKAGMICYRIIVRIV